MDIPVPVASTWGAMLSSATGPAADYLKAVQESV
jgi:hypothetical protein